jgi:Fe-S-cluster containining protein
MASPPTERPPAERLSSWFDAGLRFECTGCGRCCSGGNGYVWVSEREIARLAVRFGVGLDDFGLKYLRRVGDRYALLESVTDGACVFLDGDRCGVYEDRPNQCRSFPFWGRNLESPAAWARAAGECEGIRDDAPLLGREEIESRRRNCE